MSFTNTGSRLRALVLSGLLACAGSAQAAAWVSSPSSDRDGATVPITGGGMTPGGQVRLSLVDNQGTEIDSWVVALDAEGGFQFDLPIGDAFGYLLEAWVVGSGSQEPDAFTYVVAGSGVPQ